MTWTFTHRSDIRRGAVAKPQEDETRTIIVAITGASGAPYGVRMLSLLRDQPGIETHLIVSHAGVLTLRHECGLSLRDVETLADVTYRPGDVGAAIASGSFHADAMVVAPCSIKTLSAIAWTYADDLISRAADVCLKEGRPLLLLVRETPLHLGHLRAMTAAAEAGAIIAPPVPAFYAQPVSIEELVDHTARRALDRVGVREVAPKPWQGEIGGRIADRPE
jgi:4-hydroxy-3-polyprenylbenzoate decarboxylase